MNKKTHFGFQSIDEATKNQKVADVFESVSHRYNVMNDVMSGGLHRLWKRFAVAMGYIKSGDKVLDIASGTADLALRLAQCVGSDGEVWCTDINLSMLRIGRNRLLDKGLVMPVMVADAEKLPFRTDYFDCVFVSFGLRNMTHQDEALSEMYRVLKPAGRLVVLEFSTIWKPLTKLYDFYTLKILPHMGRWVANNAESYRYLAESIQVHPNQETVKKMMTQVGFRQVDYFNLTAGVVALHRGFKPTLEIKGKAYPVSCILFRHSTALVC